MGVISLVVCGNIYLLFCEENVVNDWVMQLDLYKRYLDDIWITWKE